MQTIQLGSKGPAVVQLQHALGIAVDGIFGTKTRDAVIAYQRSHAYNGIPLTVDGIVGVQTWAALGINPVDDARPDIIMSPLSVHITKRTRRPILYLAIHYTAGSRSTAGAAKAVKSVFEKRSASADFCVDDTQILQFNPDPSNYYCWAVGDAHNPYTRGGRLYGKACNSNTISIEICSTLQKGTSSSAANHPGWSFTDAALRNAVALTKYLMQKYGIPIDHVVRHYDITGKLCPGIVGWNDGPLYDTQGKKTTTQNTSDQWIHFICMCQQ